MKRRATKRHRSELIYYIQKFTLSNFYLFPLHSFKNFQTFIDLGGQTLLKGFFPLWMSNEHVPLEINSLCAFVVALIADEGFLSTML